jgi:hypothetical protein
MPIFVRNALDHSWRGKTLCARGHTRAHCAGEKHFLHCPAFAGSPMLAAVVVTNTARSSLNYAPISALICYSEASAIFRFLTCVSIPKSRIGQTWLAIKRWRDWVAPEFKKRVIPRANQASAGNCAVTPSCHAGRLRRAVPDRHRSAKSPHGPSPWKRKLLLT